MKKSKTQKGITLIALIITIVVLLILAVVTINAIQGDGIIRYAENAADEYTSKSNEEQETLDYYSTVLEDNQPGSSISSRTEEGVPIPVGFKYVSGTKNTGVVIENETEGSQFVWVPVITPITATESEPATSASFDSKEANLKRAGCEDFDKDGKLTITEFKTQLTNEFNAMAESVKKYGGFYVGRYETSIKGKTVQSKKWTTQNPVTILTNSSTSTDWYGQYARCKTYATTSVQGSMIWGSQYDAMITWMGNLAMNFNTSLRNTDSQRRTGYVGTDVVKNIYDLAGCNVEWTMEAKSADRVGRGGSMYTGWAIDYRCVGWDIAYPTCTYDSMTARLALYII